MSKVDMRNPFEVYEKIKRDRAAAKTALYAYTYSGARVTADDPLAKRIMDSMDSMAKTMRAVEGVCSLHVDLDYSEALRGVRWWEFGKRRALVDGKEAWKRERFTELREEARKKELEW